MFKINVRKGIKYSVVPNLSYIPYDSSTIYFLDIDNTLLKSKHIVNKQNNKPKYVEIYVPFSDSNQDLLSQVSPENIVIVTYRPKDTKDITIQHLADNGIKYSSILFAENKGEEIKAWISEHGKLTHNYVFADDLVFAIEEVLMYCPFIDCYRIDPLLYTKMCNRQKRHFTL